VALLTVLAGLVGWYYGQPILAVACVLLCLVGYWIYQMQQVQLWLSKPEQPPPEIYGIWGDILSQISQHQRKDKEARARLQSTVDYLRDSFASMRDGVAIVDGQGVLKWFNQPAANLLELRPGDKGQSLMNLVRAPEFVRYLNQGNYQDPLQYRSGGELRAHLRIEITPFGEGDRLLFVRDVTANSRMEQTRRDFVANVSHELRTPLTVITGYLGTFLGDTDRLNPSYIKPLQQMLQQSERMENLLKDLLLLSKIESEHGAEAHEPVDISALLAELEDELSTTYPDRKIELEIAVAHKVQGDYRDLYSAVSNLVLNAIKYSPADSPVQISWRQQGGSFCLAVSDQGIGVDANHIPRLTERFYRVDDSRHAATGGTGLGLAIVKHVAVAHGARLLIESEVGRGSTFSLEFPGTGEAQDSQYGLGSAA
jgi:two-component system phosphate regulon sensor histidine kinase PhoR